MELIKQFILKWQSNIRMHVYFLEMESQNKEMKFNSLLKPYDEVMHNWKSCRHILPKCLWYKVKAPFLSNPGFTKQRAKRCNYGKLVGFCTREENGHNSDINNANGQNPEKLHFHLLYALLLTSEPPCSQQRILQGRSHSKMDELDIISKFADWFYLVLTKLEVLISVPLWVLH